VGKTNDREKQRRKLRTEVISFPRIVFLFSAVLLAWSSSISLSVSASDQLLGKGKGKGMRDDYFRN
jgi:hypothetical protein